MRRYRPVLGRDVLLFFEDRDRDTFVAGDRRLRRALRRALAPVRPHKPRVSGFEMAFTLLRRALERAGLRVHVNDYGLARRNPDYPVGICGYPHIIDRWNLPNPAVLGPGLLDHPKIRPLLMTDPRFRRYLVRCDWMRDVFATVYDRDVLALWFAGIDLEEWPDASRHAKDLDVLVYDKIRWRRDTEVANVLDPILAELSRRGLRFQVIRYGRHTHATYRRLLGRSRSMIFLCEHETQGEAYQEAMASNIPILAWDRGIWLDPNRTRWEARPVAASSVPYFSHACGERFTGVADFDAALDRFWSKLESYTPRDYVREHLSPSASAERYLRGYRAAAIPREPMSRQPSRPSAQFQDGDPTGARPSRA